MPQIKRSDILMGLDGTIYIEGENGQALANVFIRNQRRALKGFRRIAPDITARDISIDSLGRVCIKNTKVTQVAITLSEPDAVSAVGSALANDPVSATARAGNANQPAPDDVSPSDDDDRDALEVDFICRDEGPERDLDIICGRWDEEGEGFDCNFGCGYFS